MFFCFITDKLMYLMLLIFFIFSLKCYKNFNEKYCV